MRLDHEWRGLTRAVRRTAARGSLSSHPPTLRNVADRDDPFVELYQVHVSLPCCEKEVALLQLPRSATIDQAKVSETPS